MGGGRRLNASLWAAILIASTMSPGPAPQGTAPPPREAHPRGRAAVEPIVRDRWPGDDGWAVKVVDCETGKTWDPAVVSPNGKYHGLFQFSDGTWAANGGSGHASRAPVEEQVQRAWDEHRKHGRQPWPRCGR